MLLHLAYAQPAPQRAGERTDPLGSLSRWHSSRSVTGGARPVSRGASLRGVAQDGARHLLKTFANGPPYEQWWLHRTNRCCTRNSSADLPAYLAIRGANRTWQYQSRYPFD